LTFGLTASLTGLAMASTAFTHTNAQGSTDIEAEVYQGTKRDAFLACLKANGKHGKPRTPDERRYVVQMALEDIELGEKTDTEIALQSAMYRQ
jgi:hypothetical protein